MPDTLMCDISEHQATPLDDSYPYRSIIIRSNDGTYRDKRFRQNYAWCIDALNRGKLDFFGIYFVYWPNWQDGEATFWSQVGGDLDPRVFVMIDMESWGGKLTGDQSAGANALRESLISKLGGNRKRVIAYGNEGDLASLWPDRGDALVNVANYTRLPNVRNMLLHQFTSSADVDPFPGRVDLNTANGHDVPSLMNALGLTTDHLEARSDDADPIDTNTAPEKKRDPDMPFIVQPADDNGAQYLLHMDSQGAIIHHIDPDHSETMVAAYGEPRADWSAAHVQRFREQAEQLGLPVKGGE